MISRHSYRVSRAVMAQQFGCTAQVSAQGWRNHVGGGREKSATSKSWLEGNAFI